MIRSLTKNEIIFYERWTEKANRYSLEELNDVVDKFFTAYVIFNYLYNTANKLYKYRISVEKKKVTEVPVKLLMNYLIAKEEKIIEKSRELSCSIKQYNFTISSTKKDKQLLDYIAG